LPAANRDELQIHRGPRRRIWVERTEIERWLRSKPHRPAQSQAAQHSDLDQWATDTEAELRSLGGGQ
jgi:hypothetical protein